LHDDIESIDSIRAICSVELQILKSEFFVETASRGFRLASDFGTLDTVGFNLAVVNNTDMDYSGIMVHIFKWHLVF
jgi:hypothetical protein